MNISVRKVYLSRRTYRENLICYASSEIILNIFLMANELKIIVRFDWIFLVAFMSIRCFRNGEKTTLHNIGKLSIVKYFLHPEHVYISQIETDDHAEDTKRKLLAQFFFWGLFVRGSCNKHLSPQFSLDRFSFSWLRKQKTIFFLFWFLVRCLQFRFGVETSREVVLRLR